MRAHSKSLICDQQEQASAMDADTHIFHPLRNLSAEEFAVLGGDKTVFIRSISVKELASFLPEASNMPDDVQFQMIMGANGVPILITDSTAAISDWFEHNEVRQVFRH